MERITIAEKFICGHVSLNSILPTSRTAQPSRNLWSRVRLLVTSTLDTPKSIQRDIPCPKCQAEQKRTKEENESDRQDLACAVELWKEIHDAHVANGQRGPASTCELCHAQRRTFSILCGGAEKFEILDEWNTSPTLSEEEDSSSEEKSSEGSEYHDAKSEQSGDNSTLPTSLVSTDQDAPKNFSEVSITQAPSDEDDLKLDQFPSVPSSELHSTELRITDPDTEEGQAELDNPKARGINPPNDPAATEGETELHASDEAKAKRIRDYFGIPSRIATLDLPDYIEQRFHPDQSVRSLLHYPTHPEEADGALARYIPLSDESLDVRDDVVELVLEIAARGNGKRSKSSFNDSGSDSDSMYDSEEEDGYDVSDEDDDYDQQEEDEKDQREYEVSPESSDDDDDDDDDDEISIGKRGTKPLVADSKAQESPELSSDIEKQDQGTSDSKPIDNVKQQEPIDTSIQQEKEQETPLVGSSSTPPSPRPSSPTLLTGELWTKLQSKTYCEFVDESTTPSPSPTPSPSKAEALSSAPNTPTTQGQLLSSRRYSHALSPSQTLISSRYSLNGKLRRLSGRSRSVSFIEEPGWGKQLFSKILNVQAAPTILISAAQQRRNSAVAESLGKTSPGAALSVSAAQQRKTSADANIERTLQQELDDVGFTSDLPDAIWQEPLLSPKAETQLSDISEEESQVEYPPLPDDDAEAGYYPPLPDNGDELESETDGSEGEDGDVSIKDRVTIYSLYENRTPPPLPLRSAPPRHSRPEGHNINELSVLKGEDQKASEEKKKEKKGQESKRAAARMEKYARAAARKSSPLREVMSAEDIEKGEKGVVDTYL